MHVYRILSCIQCILQYTILSGYNDIMYNTGYYHDTIHNTGYYHDTCNVIQIYRILSGYNT